MARRRMKFYCPLGRFLSARVNWPFESLVKCETGKLKAVRSAALPETKRWMPSVHLGESAVRRRDFADEVRSQVFRASGGRGNEHGRMQICPRIMSRNWIGRLRRLVCSSNRGPLRRSDFGIFAKEPRASLHFHPFNPRFDSHLHDISDVTAKSRPQGVK